tara:strand:+ start:13667 stop:14320 length:654 start_codon:yes stop_codon:yes gene_type:complete
VVLLFVSLTSSNLFAGKADTKNESMLHISTQNKAHTLLSLDDVLPGEQSLFIKPTSEAEKARDSILIRVTGYSAYESEQGAKSESKRLLAQRASKLDAYRALSERVYGIAIKGQSTVKDFMLKEDRFSVGFDSFVRGARVVSINEKKGVGFETVLELVLPSSFEDCLNKVNNFKNGLNCLRPLPNASLFLDTSGEMAARLPKQISSKNFQGSAYFLQ